jgi:uncharacterized metal-binding protein
MAPGRSHDRATALLALPFGLLWGPWLGPAGVAVAAAAFLVGGLWLSPDLDTHSNATRRWGLLGVLWWPYRRALPHRSPLSHSPLVGSAGRLLYLALLLGLAAALLQPWGFPGPRQLLTVAAGLWQGQRPLVVVALVGFELSSWLHLLQDGDPTPRLRFTRPRLLRRRGGGWRRGPRRR